MVISSKQKSVVTGVQKSNDMKQITTEVISTRIPMITKWIGIIQMSILYLAPPINYPGGAPEFKQYVRTFSMDNYIIVPDGSMNFETISEFKRSLKWGAEIEFVWNNITYGVVRYGTNNKITIYQANRPETEKVCDTADDALEYMLGNDRLRDVVTQVKVVSRTI